MQKKCKFKGTTMLLEFKAENYRSFKDEFVFKMEPSPKKKDLLYSLLKQKIEKKTYTALCSSIIYGANAAGKSNIIGAIDTFREILKRGTIKDDISNKVPMNAAAYKLEVIPNNKLEEIKPVSFSIKFINDEILFEYILKIDLGAFMQPNYDRKILEEKLYVNNDLLFKRGEKVEILENKTLKKYINKNLPYSNKELFQMIASASLKKDELFLSNGFKNIFSTYLYDVIRNWIDYKLTVIYASMDFKAYLAPINENNSKIHDYINALDEVIGVNSNKICYLSVKDEAKPKLCSLFDKIKAIIPAELIESYGTIRLINLLMPLIDTLVNGTTLIIDEFDCSLHPMIVMSLINLFHDNEININNAQLIFNTHNPIFLNKNLFRRDEIKFVERENDTFSILYSLADFSTTGKNSVRKTTDYMRNYFINRYGAIKNINLIPLFEKILSDPDIQLVKQEIKIEK